LSIKLLFNDFAEQAHAVINLFYFTKTSEFQATSRRVILSCEEDKWTTSYERREALRYMGGVLCENRNIFLGCATNNTPKCMKVLL
jgi:hypothetical protein